MGFGAVAALSGTVGSYYLNTAPGSLIVVIAIGLFALSWPLSKVLQRRQRPIIEVADAVEPATHELTESHPHVHSENCGHLPVQHAGHVDYVHDGHRHAAHGDHYDEH
jgi:zinc transport system permease protein